MSGRETATLIRQRYGMEQLDCVLILGSGLAGFTEQVANLQQIDYAELPGFPRPGVGGHKASLGIGRIGRQTVAILGGREHYYENARADAMRVALETLSRLGAKILLVTNSAGTAHNGFSSGELMLIRDHINVSIANPLIGVGDDSRFVDLSTAYDADLRQLALQAAADCGVALREGVYAAFSGPSFETPAEVRMAATLGADAVGMSTVPEVILARWLGMRVLGISNLTNPGAGLADEPLSHQQTQEAAARAARRFSVLLNTIIERL